MIGVAELLLIAAIILLVFGTTRLSRAADTTKAAVKVGKKRFWVTNPVTGEKELTLMSVEKELALGKRTDAEVRQKWGLYEDQALQTYVQTIGLRMAKASHRPDLPWRFTVVDDSSVNAFAAPGGYIYVTRGLLAYLCDEAELAGVLAHEIGHVTARHRAKGYTREHGAQAGLWLVRIFWPAARTLSGFADKGLDMLFLSYGRDAELESDRLAIGYTAACGWDPAGLPRVLTTLGRLQDAGGEEVPTWLSTHPSTPDRVAQLEDGVTQARPRLTEAGRETYRQQIQGLAFGDGPSTRIGVYTVRDGDTWQAIAKQAGHGQAAATLAIMNGYPATKQPRARGADQSRRRLISVDSTSLFPNRT